MRWWLASLSILLFASALAYVAVSWRIGSTWPPSNWPYAASVPFVTPDVPGASTWWTLVAACETVWSLAYAGLVFLFSRPLRFEMRKLQGAILAGQFALLVIVLFAPIPYNSDQYLYVAYGDLAGSGANPYDPPLKTAQVPSAVRAISTAWSIHEGAADATKRIVLRNRYGPTWTLAIAAVLRPFRDLGPVAQARVLRVFDCVALIAAGFLMRLALADVLWGTAALAAFALNPLFITQTALGGHNDVVALALGIAAYVAASRSKFLLAGFAVGLSIGAKLSFAPYLLPLAAFGWRRSGWRGLVATVFPPIVVLALSALPFGLVRAILQPLADASRYNRSYVASAVESFIGHHFPAIGLFPAYEAYVAITVIMAVAFAVTILRGTRSTAVEIALILLIFGAAYFEPWYGFLLTPLLLMRSRLALWLFVALTLACQVLERNKFIGGYAELPFVPFILLGFVLIAFALIAHSILTRQDRLEAYRPSA